MCEKTFLLMRFCQDVTAEKQETVLSIGAGKQSIVGLPGILLPIPIPLNKNLRGILFLR